MRTASPTLRALVNVLAGLLANAPASGADREDAARQFEETLLPALLREGFTEEGARAYFQAAVEAQTNLGG